MERPNDEIEDLRYGLALSIKGAMNVYLYIKSLEERIKQFEFQQNKCERENQ